MYIHRSNPYTRLLRVSYRSGSSVKKYTLENLSGWTENELDELAGLLAKRRKAKGAERQELSLLILNLFARRGWKHPSQAYQMLAHLRRERKTR